MVVKSFTLPNYFIKGKDKQEIEERILRAPLQSCFVTSVFVGISIVPFFKGSRAGSRVCNAL